MDSGRGGGDYLSYPIIKVKIQCSVLRSGRGGGNNIFYLIFLFEWYPLRYLKKMGLAVPHGVGYLRRKERRLIEIGRGRGEAKHFI